ncbi:MAG: mevalonate kinase [Galactobacter sp.]
MTTGSMSLPDTAAGRQNGQARRRAFEGVGAAHGKVILTGEHAVVYGQPAVAVPLSEVNLVATVRADGQGMLVSTPYSGPLEDAPAALDPVLTALGGAAGLVGLPTEGLSLTIEGDVPMGRGLGSSAAVATAVVRAVVDLGARRGLSVQGHDDAALPDGGARAGAHAGSSIADPSGRSSADRALHALVQQAETIAHGKSSGLDPYAVAASGPILFRGGRPTLLELSEPLTLVVGDSGSHGSTAQAVGAVRTLMADDPLPTRERIEILGQISEATVRVLSGEAPRAGLGALLNQAHQVLSELGVSTPELDTLAAAALAAGADGAKLTGSGLGGCVVALVSSSESATAVSHALTTAGAARVWTSTLESPADQGGLQSVRQEEAL